jgi:quercetin dioxygenase-like cupin family protein
MTLKVVSEQTGGAYSLFEVTSPRGGESPPHAQHHGDEFLYVLEGELEFRMGDRATRMGAGSSVYVPRGSLHSNKNVGDGPARMLVSHTPGRAHERFFEVIGRPPGGAPLYPPAGAPPSMEKISAIAAEHGIEIPPPCTRARAKEPK